eukprot:4613745-Amphidinium_carterae.2
MLKLGLGGLGLLCAPDDEEDDVLKKLPQDRSGLAGAPKPLDPVTKNLDQWRIICMDFNRFRGKNHPRCKALIRAGIPEFLRGSVWQKLALSREVLQKQPQDLYDQMRDAKTAPCE